MADGDKLPTISEAISNWLGVQLPSLHAPQTLKNLDKAISKVVLASGENIAERIKDNTSKVKARGEIAVEGMYRTADDERKGRNRAATTKAAMKDLEREPPSEDAKEEISDDWLNLFSRIAEDKSSAELQELFGRILAGEVKRPGSFSLRTIQVMSTVSKGDADQISKYLSFAVEHSIVPVLGGKPDYTLQLLMNELGIAGNPGELGGSLLNFTMESGSNKLLICSGFGVLVTNSSARDIKIEISGQILTTTGRELLTIARPGPVGMEHLRELANSVHENLRGTYPEEIKEQKIIVTAVQIVGRLGQELRCRSLQKAPIEIELKPVTPT